MAEGRKIGNFELLERLGQGGMGAVFKARQVSMDRIVALKVLPPSLAKQPTFIERFMREARASARLSHPHIVGGIDVGQDGGVYYFAMEFVDGSSAKDLVAKGKLSEAQVLKIGKAIAQALAHAHAHGILHRDIKPDNILIDKNGTPKLCDLGLARLDTQTEGEKALTQDGMALGTPHYISPEQARGKRDLDAKTDLYSLGATLYHLLTGTTMYDGGTTTVVVMTKHVTEKCPNPADVGAQVSKGMLAILAKLLTKARADRYESAEKLAEDLDRVAHGKPPQHAELPAAKWPFSGGVPGAPARKPGSTGPVSPVDKGRAPHHEGQPDPGPKKAPWLVPAGVLAAIVIVVIVCLGRSGPSAPPPETAPAKTPAPLAGRQTPPPPQAVPSSADAKRLFEAAEDFAKKNPNDFAGALAEFEKARAAARGTEFAGKALDAIAAITRRRDEAGEAAARKYAADADALAAQAKYDAAVAVWEGVPADQVGLLRARAAKAIGDLRAQAEAKLKAVADEAEKCIADKRWADGKKALDAAGSIEYRAGNARLQDLRGKLAAGEQAEAEAARSAAAAAAETTFTRYVNAFVSTTLKGDVKAARKIAADAKADAALKDLAAKSQELSAVCDALDKADAAKLAALEVLKDGRERSFETTKVPVKGVVSRVTADEIHVSFKMGGAAGEQKIKLSDLAPAERKRLAGDFKPQSPAEHLALAIRALAAEDTAGATAALAAAKDHPLAPPYQAKLDEKQLGAVEAAAKSAWDAIMRASGTGKLSEKAAKDIGDRVAAFEADHGKTKFAASIAAAMAALKERLLAAGGGWKHLPVESLRVVTKGQATFAVDNGTLVVNSPLPPANNAVIPLLPFARDFKLQFEYNGHFLEMALRKINWHGSVNLLIRTDGFRARTYPTDDPQQQQRLAADNRPGLLAPGWHKIEIAAIGRTLTVALDGTVLCKEEHLPAVARGEVLLWAWPGPTGGKHEYRNFMVAQLDKEVNEGTSEGLLMDNVQGNPCVVFKADYEDVPRRYPVPQLPGGGPDLQVLEPLKKVVSLNRLKLSWKLQPDFQPVVTAVQVERPPATNGVLIGTITFLQGGCIELAPDNGPPERFIPVWRPGGPDRNLVQAMAKLKVGDKAKATWTYDDRKRVTAIEPAP